ncbi:MAG: thymidylate kinase [Firmicutes bacterium]|nr:thymidylate kinase [Bacillota bacterium]
MKGKLIIIEAGDGSGKETQTKKLYKRLQEDQRKVLKVEYPNYASESSALIKMYLKGDFGNRPGDVSPYVASTFYAVDRYASYKKEWESFYNEGGIILADRYTTSNMVHQAAKITNEQEREKYLKWLWDFEFNTFGLPIPDCVIFLDMPPAFSTQLIQNRNNKFTGQQEKDIHEKDSAYLEQAYYSSLWLAEKYSWHRVLCVNDQGIKSIDEIHEEVYHVVNILLSE